MRIISSARCRVSFLFLLLLLIVPVDGHAGEPDLTIFFSSDTRGMMRRCGCTDGQLGGLSARASYIKSHRNSSTVVLDAGDTIFDSLDDPRDRKEFYDLKASVLMRAMKQSGYDAILPGEYDLEFGPEFLREKAVESGNKLVCANLETTGGAKAGEIFNSSVIKKAGDIRLGITGVIDDKFPYASFPSVFGNIRAGDPLKSARRQVKSLRKKTDIVVLLAHLSVSDPEKIIKESGADIVIMGHGGEGNEQPLKSGNTLVVKGFYKGKRIGRLDLWVNKQGGAGTIKDYKYEVVRLGEDIPPDPEVESLIAYYRHELKAKKFVFTDRTGLRGYFAGPDKCMECHGAAFANWSATGHARAFASLEKTGDQYDPECLPCHVTGYGFPSGYKDPARGGKADLKNVTCEDCHGAAGAHYDDKKLAKMPPKGYTITGPVAEKICTGCHDDYNSPNFEFEKFKAMGGAHRRSLEIK